MFTYTFSPNLQYSRRLLLDNPLHQIPQPPKAAATNPVDPTEPYNNNGFDANVVMILLVLLCALICSLGLNTIIKCALRCSCLASSSTTMTSNNSTDPSARLANTGIKKKALKSFAVVSYSPDLKLPGLDTECVICLSEFVTGEKVRLLPQCNHGFHARCIDKWLNSHSSCPTCRHCLIEACQKIVGCDQASSSQPASLPQPIPATVIAIAPLERENIARSYRCIS